MFYRHGLDSINELRDVLISSPVDNDKTLVVLSSKLFSHHRAGLYRLKSGFSGSGEVDDGSNILASSTMSDWYWQRIIKGTRKNFISNIETLADQESFTLTHDDDVNDSRIIGAFVVDLTEYNGIATPRKITLIIDISGKDRDMPFSYIGFGSTQYITLSKTYRINNLGAPTPPPGETLMDGINLAADGSIYIGLVSGGLARYQIGPGVINHDGYIAVAALSSYHFIGSDIAVQINGLHSSPAYVVNSVKLESDGSLTYRDPLGGPDSDENAFFGYEGCLLTSGLYISDLSKPRYGLWFTWPTVIESTVQHDTAGSGWGPTQMLELQAHGNDMSALPIVAGDSYLFIDYFDSTICLRSSSGFEYCTSYSGYLPYKGRFIFCQNDVENAIILACDFNAVARGYCHRMTISESNGKVTSVNHDTYLEQDNPYYVRNRNIFTSYKKADLPVSNGLFVSHGFLFFYDQANFKAGRLSSVSDMINTEWIGDDYGSSVSTGVPLGNNIFLLSGMYTETLMYCDFEEIEEYFSTGMIIQDVVKNATAISSITCTQIETANSGIRYLVERDGSYYKWSGTHWVVEADALLGNTKTEFEGCDKALLISEVGDTFSIVVVMISNDGTETPSFHSVDITYTRGSEFNMGSYIHNGYISGDIQITKASATETLFKNNSGSTLSLQGRVHLEQ